MHIFRMMGFLDGIGRPVVNRAFRSHPTFSRIRCVSYSGLHHFSTERLLLGEAVLQREDISTEFGAGWIWSLRWGGSSSCLLTAATVEKHGDSRTGETRRRQGNLLQDEYCDGRGPWRRQVLTRGSMKLRHSRNICHSFNPLKLASVLLLLRKTPSFPSLSRHIRCGCYWVSTIFTSLLSSRHGSSISNLRTYTDLQLSHQQSLTLIKKLSHDLPHSYLFFWSGFLNAFATDDEYNLGKRTCRSRNEALGWNQAAPTDGRNRSQNQ